MLHTKVRVAVIIVFTNEYSLYATRSRCPDSDINAGSVLQLERLRLKAPPGHLHELQSVVFAQHFFITQNVDLSKGRI